METKGKGKQKKHATGVSEHNVGYMISQVKKIRNIKMIIQH